jgi:tetratricopeptide (TPR) repeat protein
LVPDASEDTRGFGSDSQFSRSNSGTVGPNSPESAIADCELRADLAGYSSSSIRLDPSMNNSNVGVIVLHNRGKKADGMVSVANLQVPAKARKEFEKGSESLEKGHLAEAEKSLQKAIDLYPKFAEAWLRLGDLEQRRKNIEGAMADYQQAINADPNFPLPYLRMAFLSAVTSNWEQTRKLTERLISLDPVSFPLAYFYNAVAEFNLSNMARAETSTLRAESLDSLHSEPRIELLLATIYKAKGAPALAADHYRAYLKLVPDGPLNERVKSDLAKTEQMAKSQDVATPPVNK